MKIGDWVCRVSKSTIVYWEIFLMVKIVFVKVRQVCLIMPYHRHEILIVLIHVNFDRIIDILLVRELHEDDGIGSECQTDLERLCFT